MKEEWYEKARNKTIEKTLKECNYEFASRPYFENVKITANPVHVEHEFCNGKSKRLKEININIDFGEEVIQEFGGSMDQLEIETIEAIRDIIDSYVTVCIENPEG